MTLIEASLPAPMGCSSCALICSGRVLLGKPKLVKSLMSASTPTYHTGTSLRGNVCVLMQTLFTEVATNTLGPKVMKALYVAYTSEAFTTRVTQPPEHGLLGPLISAEVSTPCSYY